MRIVTPIFCLLALALAGCASSSGSRGVDYNPEAAQLNAQLGARYMAQDNLQLANIKLSRAIAQDPRSSLAHSMFGVLQEKLGEHEKAETHYKKALSLDNKNSRARNNYGTFLCKRGRLQEADEQFQKAISDPLYRGLVSANLNAARCALKIPDIPRAESYFAQALKRDRKNRVALYQLAKLAYERGAGFEARLYLQRFEKAAAATPQTLWLGYQVEKKLGDEGRSSYYARELISSFPTSREARELTRLN